MANENKTVDEDELAKGCNFDRLPDELVVSILDGLIWKDAATTSTLSRRFHHVWKSFLEGNKQLILKHNSYKGKGKDGSFTEFVDFVKHILLLHKGSKLDSLQISFTRHSFEMWREMDKVKDGLRYWVDFARAKCVQSLDLDLYASYRSWYQLPQFPTFEGFDRLTSLSLSGIRVNDAQLEHDLVNLESLCLKYVPGLERVVITSSQKLKKLVIKHCPHIQSINVVSAPNLECFVFHGRRVVIEHFNGMPKLSQVSLVGVCQEILLKLQKVKMLERLKLHQSMACANYRHVLCWTVPPRFPLQHNLKELYLTFEDLEEFPMLFVDTVLAACPKLRKLKVENRRSQSGFNGMNDYYEVATEDDQLGMQIHPCLKEVNFCCWCAPNMSQVVNHLREIAPNAVISF